MVPSRLIQPFVKEMTLAGGSSQTTTANQINFGDYVIYLQITNEATHSLKVYINEYTTPFTLDANSTQIFNKGDMSINYIAFDNSASGSSSAFVKVIAGIAD